MALTFIPANDEKPDWATETQWRAVKAVEEHGSTRKAAAALGVASNAIWEPLDRYRKEAARRGHAPGHFEDGVAPGYRMGLVTVQRGPGGVERTWERQSPELAGPSIFCLRVAFQTSVWSAIRAKPETG